MTETYIEFTRRLPGTDILFPVEVKVSADIIPGSPARLSGPNCHPATEAEVDDLRVVGSDIELTPDEIEIAKQALLEAAEEEAS